MILKKVKKAIKLYDPRNLYSLSIRVMRLENKLNTMINNPNRLWLEINKDERMDALIEDDDYTNPIRRNFHLDRYNFALDFVKDKNVADVACGTGYGTRLLLEKGMAKHCIGVDIDEATVSYAQKTHNVKGSKFVCSPAENVPLKNNSIDTLVSFETLEHVSDENILIEEFFRILKPGGKLIISTPNEWPLSMMSHHTKEYDLEEFKRVLETKFEIKRLFNQNSGHNWKYNHNQERGMIITTDKNKALAECFIAICEKKV
jgi:2-polyprenyl-3-methyl-5-hydroxy-6-metoxy-1,4-benzoquinol methylase